MFKINHQTHQHKVHKHHSLGGQDLEEAEDPGIICLIKEALVETADRAM